MRYLTYSGRLIGLLSLCGLLLAPLGCNKLLANYNLGKAQKRVQEALKNEAQNFTREKLEQTQNAINKATQEVTIQNFQAAAQTAKEASQLSKDLLEQTKNLRANKLKEDAFIWLERAKLNQAEAINAETFGRIRADNERGQGLIEKQKWDKAIVVYVKVIEDVNFLLKNLQTEAKQGLEIVNGFKQDLIQQGAPEFAPEKVEEINGQISEIQTLIEKDFNYRRALALRESGRQTWQEGITLTKQVKSQKLILEIENLLDEATQLNAVLYAQQSYRIVAKDYDNLLTKFYDKNYDTVLVQAPDLKPKVQALILETKRTGAQAMIDAVQTAINNLTDGKARLYLPGNVEQLDALIGEAKALFEKGETDEADNYTESKKVSQRALDLEEKILDDFDNLAEQQIGKAQDELAKAESVFNRMEEIFDKQIPGDWTGADKALEDSKQALKQELRTSLVNAKISLGLAQNKRAGKGFDVAIEISKQVAQTSDHIQQQTYRVVAHNAVLEISIQLTRFERDGGRQYAPAEVDKTHTLLQDSKQLLHGDKYREAVRRTADTKAQIEVLAQQLERVAVDRIQLAQQAIASAKNHRAEDFQNESYQQAVVALDRARAALEGEALKESIESSLRAENIATDASTGALRSWTEEFMKKADELIAQARAAGAERYAPDQLQSSLELRQNLQQLYDQTSYPAAVDTGRQAVDAAHHALYALIENGENAIAAARQFGAWEYEAKRLTEAMVSLKFAREALEQGDYKNAELHAHNAINLGNKLQLEAKQAGFNASMDALDTRLATAENRGAHLFQTGDIGKILGEMNQLRNQFDPKAYEDYSKRVELLEARLASLVEKTPDVLKDVVIKMQDRLGAEEARGARSFMPALVEEVERKIKYAQIDFRAEKYRSSFLNAKDSQVLLDKIRLQLDEREFDADLNDILASFTRELDKFGPVLNMGTPTLLRMILGEDGKAHAVAILQASSPSELRQNISELGSRVRLLPAPVTRRNQKDAALEMFAVAKTSATNFEKMLILDQYDIRQARDIIQTAFLQMADARGRQHDLMATIKYPQVRYQPAGVERVVSFKE